MAFDFSKLICGMSEAIKKGWSCISLFYLLAFAIRIKVLFQRTPLVLLRVLYLLTIEQC